MGLEVKQYKTKHLVMYIRTIDDPDLIVGNHTFQQVRNFKYSRININKHSKHNEIKLGIFVANKRHYTLGKLFKSKLLSKRSKERQYLSFLRPVLTYAREKWSLRETKETCLILKEDCLDEFMD